MIQNKIILQTIGRILLIMALCFLVLWIAIGNEGMLQIWRGVSRSFIKPDYTKNTNPLSINVQADLCEKFDIRNDDPLCQKGSIVYAFEFYSVICSYFYRLPEHEQNLEVVQEKIGKYQFKKEERTQGESRYLIYWYDFTGDKTYPLVIQYEDSGKIRRINIGAGRDSG